MTLEVARVDVSPGRPAPTIGNRARSRHDLLMRTAPTFLPAVPFLLAAVAASACASTVTSGETGPAAQTALRASEIVRLHTREGDIAVLAGSGARRVTIYDASGTPLRSTDVASLRSSDPTLFELLTTSTASTGLYLDATLRDASQERPASLVPSAGRGPE